MKISQVAMAGTLESSDAMIRVAPASGRDIEINSSVGKQFGQAIYDTVIRVLDRLNVQDCQVIVEDKGALDCVLEARLQAALLRASDEQPEWEKLL